MIPPPKRHKFGVAPKPDRTNRDGIVFHSKGEMLRWEELRLLERAGQIAKLRRQVEYPLKVNGVAIGTYVADFVYEARLSPGPGWTGVVEDFKGCRTPEYEIKRSLMLAIYGITILETGTRPRSRARSAKPRRGRAGSQR